MKRNRAAFASSVGFFVLFWSALVGTSLARAGQPGTLEATLEFATVNQVNAPIQWGSPVPDFEPQERPMLSLGGVWRKARVNLDHDLSFTKRDASTIAALEAEGEGRHLPEYDDSAWADKTLPAVESAMPGDESHPPEAFHGGVWYRRSVTVPAEWEGRVNRLSCLGASYIFDLWVNGQYVGVHEGGYTPFAFDLSDYLNYGGQNVFAVRVDKPFPGVRQDAAPSWFLMDWWDYAGIIQDIYLDSAPPLHVVRTNIFPRDYNGRIEVQVLVANASAEEQTAIVTLRPYHVDPDADGYLADPRPASIIGRQAYLEGEPSTALQIPAGQLAAAVFHVRVIAPQRWTPREPNLYVMDTRLAAGELTDEHYNQFGLRTVETADHQIKISGRVAFLPGIARHEEWPDAGRAATWDRILEDLQIIQDLNALYLRSAHYPNHPYTYLLTDRLGIAVMEEIPVYWFMGWNWKMQEERRIADQMFREMLLAGANRPSIIMWSMSNECPFVWAYANRAYNQRLAQDARELIGDGRLVTQSPAADSWRLSLVTEDPIDVAGWTTYYGVFYDGDTTQDMYEGTRDFIARHAAARPELPIVSTEYGFWSGEDDALLEEQREAMEATFRAFRENAALDENGAVRPDGYVAAATWWTAFNWFTKNGLPDFIAGYLEVMGAIHMDRTHEKPVAAALRAAYEPYFEFGGLGPVPDDYVDEEEPTDDDASPDDDDDDNNDSANPSIDDDDDDDNGGCGC